MSLILGHGVLKKNSKVVRKNSLITPAKYVCRPHLQYEYGIRPDTTTETLKSITWSSIPALQLNDQLTTADAAVDSISY